MMTYSTSALAELLCQRLLEKPTATLQALTEELGVERHTGSIAIKSRFGLTFRALKRQILVEIAKKLLARPNLSIKEVSVHLGFQAGETFSRFFREATGEPPTAYRQNLGGQRLIKGATYPLL